MNFYNENRYKTMKKALASMSVPESSKDEPIEIDENALFTFAAWGDPQIFHGTETRIRNFAAACRDIANTRGRLDAIAILGDVAEMGAECEYKIAADILNSISDKYSDFLCITGNHDIRRRNYTRQRNVFKDFVLSVSGGVFENNTGGYHFSKDYPHCRFILMGSNANSFEGTYINSAQRKWLEKEITEAEKQGKTAFVLNHQTLKWTNGLPVTWGGNGKWRGSIGIQSDKIREIFERHNNVVFITGHLHYGFSIYNYEDCGCFKALSVPTVGVVNHGPESRDSQGYIVSLYEDKIIIRARLHAEGKWLDKNLPGAYIEIKLK
ncbi:MAG: metallophosphoesterase [Clostridia bacterium]|nr:metallophosphoesterase [Clostridia bacterium]